jgi:hypothetical protein
MRWIPTIAYALALCASCSFDLSTRWIEPEPGAIGPGGPACTLGEKRCTESVEICQTNAQGKAAWAVLDACGQKGKFCAETSFVCVDCQPNGTFCKGNEVRKCHGDGMGSELTVTCDPSVGQACREGACPNLCQEAATAKSNVGCEYWGVDLDNARISGSLNAAGQQYAIVVSNPQPDVAANVIIYQDDGQPGDAAAPKVKLKATIPPLNLHVFKLGPREVDGSPDGEFDTGTNTALTRHAYKVASDFPVVAYQFNPLENDNVFSNDASLLKPREALSFGAETNVLAYVVASWPQTIAVTGDPNTNFDPSNPTNLRAFLTIVGTSAKTHIKLKLSTAIIGDDLTNKGKEGPHRIPAKNKGETLELDIDAFDVVNLETPSFDAFNADFTGTLIETNKPIAVFTGGEASDAPHFTSLIQRQCCADHLEEQLDPVRAAGKKFALAHEPSRTFSIKAAGADVKEQPEPNYFRFVATVDKPTTITTTLDKPANKIVLYKPGEYAEVTTTRDFMATSDQPIHVVQVTASQDASNVPRGLPGGDPSLIVVPPEEQFRTDYVFLTPDKYNFDFITVVAPPGAAVLLDNQKLTSQLCRITPTDGLTPDKRTTPKPEYITYSCQLGYPSIDPDTGTSLPGMQNDGVHRITANEPIGVIVWGFDSYVSYAYAAGTELKDIAIPQ